jgi:hypothetical protein
MKKLAIILTLFVLMVSCQQEKPKKYTITLVGKLGQQNKVTEIEALNDSIAYAQGLLALYGAKQAAKQYKFDDKYNYVEVHNEFGENLFGTLGSSTIQNIKDRFGELPHVKKIQDEIDKLPDF